MRMIKKTWIAISWLAFLLFAPTALAQTDLEKLLGRAEQGDADAQAELGSQYLFGVFRGSQVDQNYAAAEEWLTRAANQGNMYSQYLLGKMYYDCKVAEKDPISTPDGFYLLQAETWLAKFVAVAEEREKKEGAAIG